MIVGVPRETFPGERRVALVPAVLPSLTKAGVELLVERGAGAEAAFPDAAFVDKGARIAESRERLFAMSDVILQVRAYGANLEAGRADLENLRAGQVLIGMFEPLTSAEAAREVAATGATLFAMELIPRITRAQSMDVLSSMATIAGYKAVLLAADALPRMFPMMMTAAGTVTPARVLVVGAGVAGLQAIATARKLGGVVEAFDVRPAVKEQVESLGAKFVDLPIAPADAEDRGGYATPQREEFYQKQRKVMARVVAHNDVVITSAAVPGKVAPRLITGAMVSAMAAGSVIVDLAAERGGNCELTRPGDTVIQHGVTILGPLNIPTTVPYHASQMYAKNISTFLLNLMHEGAIRINRDDPIVSETLVTHGGDVEHPRVRERLRPAPAAASAGGASEE